MGEEMKIMLIGIDAADMNQVQPLIDKGRLPNIKRLINEGTSGRLKTESPTSSIMLWTSIATGVDPKRHGILHWQRIVVPGIDSVPGEPSDIICPKGSSARKIIKYLYRKNIIKTIPYSSEFRRYKALWNILTEHNKKSAVVGWLCTWPAEAINGIMASLYTYPFGDINHDFMRFDSRGIKDRTYPEDFADEVSDLIVTEKDLGKDELESLNITTEGIEQAKKYTANINSKIRPWYYSKDKTFFNISKHILDQNRDFDLFTVYLSGIDVSSHFYWPFTREEFLAGSDSQDFEGDTAALKGHIDSYYEYMDTVVGDLLKYAGEDTICLLVSDHGFKYDGSEHYAAPDGIIIACGKAIKRGYQIDNAHLYDITPTILALLGLPVAKDMQGKVLLDMLEDDFRNKCNVSYVASHARQETPRMHKDDKSSAVYDKAFKEKLRSLGYIQ